MNGTTLLAAIIIAVAVVALLGGTLIATIDERKLARSRFRRFVTHPVTVAAFGALAAGCLVGVVVVGVFTFAPNVTASATLPRLATSYSGNLHNSTINVGADMSLNSVEQSGGNISGSFQVGPPLVGSGAFTGTVNAQQQIAFDVKSASNGSSFDLHFTGTIAPGGGISGTYTVQFTNGSPQQEGTWSVKPSAGG